MIQTNYSQLANDLIAACREARTLQTLFLCEHGHMSWNTARALPQAERDALQATYTQWLMKRN